MASDEERDRDLVVRNPSLADHDDLTLGHTVVVGHCHVEVADVSGHAERGLRVGTIADRGRDGQDRQDERKCACGCAHRFPPCYLEQFRSHVRDAFVEDLV